MVFEVDKHNAVKFSILCFSSIYLHTSDVWEFGKSKKLRKYIYTFARQVKSNNQLLHMYLSVERSRDAVKRQ
jgi:hypothetical protein